MHSHLVTVEVRIKSSTDQRMQCDCFPFYQNWLEGLNPEPVKGYNLNPESVKAYNNRGLVYGRKGDYGRAIGDFNTASGLSAIFDLVSAANASVKAGTGGASLGEAATLLRELLTVLGLPTDREKPASGELEEKLLELLVGIRGEARAEKQFSIADKIRNELKALGVEIEDVPDGESRVVRRVSKSD